MFLRYADINDEFGTSNSKSIDQIIIDNILLGDITSISLKYAEKIFAHFNINSFEINFIYVWYD